MAASQMIHKKNEANLNTQKRVDGIKKNTLSADTPARRSPSTQRFQEITKKIISASSSRSSSDTHLNVPNSKARSTTSTITTVKSRRNSLAAAAIVACAVNDANCRHSHHAASSSLTTHDGPHHHPTASNGKRNGVSHPMSTSNKSKYRLSHSTTSDDQSASRKLANTSGETRETQASGRNGNAYSAEMHTKGRAGSQDLTTRNRLSELCKDCKASMMESVCFIANDGRISAATTGAAYARHFHHCNVWGCAANQRYNPSPMPLPKKALLSKRQVPHGHHSTRTSAHTTAGVGDHNGICCSAASSMQGDKWSTCDSKQELNQVGLEGCFPCKESPESRFMYAEKDRQSYEENSHAESVEARNTPPASYVSSDIHDDHDDHDDDDDAKIFGNRDAIEELNDFKSLFYHGDNEYSCSEDGTELTTTTPNSSIKGAFEDVSNIDIEQSGCDNKALQLGRSTVARMRQKYLESLREQEAETVRLRKQEIMARKQAGDWMLDCHMEEVLHRLAPNGEVRVKVLVEAYETVIHHSDSDGSQTHDQDHNFQEQEHVDHLDAS